MVRVEKVYKRNKCIVLNENNNVFVYSFEVNKIINRIDFRVMDVFIDKSIVLLETMDGLREYHCEAINTESGGNGVTLMSEYFNIFEYFSSKHNLTHKTIHVKTEENNGHQVKYSNLGLKLYHMVVCSSINNLAKSIIHQHSPKGKRLP